MGYSTDFRGRFDLDKPLTDEQSDYLVAFAETRRMERDQKIAETLPDPKRAAAGLPVGHCGCYFVGGVGFMGQDRDASVTNGNAPPPGQPSLWCQWVPSADGSGIEWDGGEKFYHYVDWLEYLIRHFLSPWGYVLNGEVEWTGEDRDDIGKIVVVNNAVSVLDGKRVYEAQP